LIRILVADDDLSLQKALEIYFTSKGFEVFKASDGLQTIEMLFLKPDIIILDIMMPKMDGIEVCKYVKTNYNIPIIFVTAKDAVEDRIIGLEAGADDYVTKPFDLKELELRLRARLQQRCVQPKDILTYNNLKIDFNNKQVSINGNPIGLTNVEFKLLGLLASQPNKILGYDQLIEQVWESKKTISVNSLQVFLRRIRNKIEQDPKNPKFIHNVWGEGYLFKS